MVPPGFERRGGGPTCPSFQSGHLRSDPDRPIAQQTAKYHVSGRKAEHFLPYMVFPILTSLLAQDQALHKAAEIMGAGRMRIFWRVTFPLSMPGVLAGVLLVTILTVGQFIIPALLGGRTDMMMANLVDFHISEAFNWNMASAISIVLLVLSCVFILGLARVRGGQLHVERKL